MDWLDLLAVQGTLKSLLQYHSSKASIFRCSAFFIVQLSHPYMTTGETIALTRWIFVGKVMSLLFNMLSRLVMTFLPRSKRLLISWLVCLNLAMAVYLSSFRWSTVRRVGANLQAVALFLRVCLLHILFLLPTSWNPRKHLWFMQTTSMPRAGVMIQKDKCGSFNQQM